MRKKQQDLSLVPRWRWAFLEEKEGSSRLHDLCSVLLEPKEFGGGVLAALACLLRLAFRVPGRLLTGVGGHRSSSAERG